MIKTVKYSILSLTLAFSFITTAQEKKVNSIQDDYKDYAYVKTSEVLLEVAEKGYRSQDLFQKLGNSFYFNNEMDQASKWYAELFKLGAEDNLSIDPEYYFRYALSLKGIGDYEASNEWMRKFNEAKPSDYRGRAFLSKVDYRAQIESKVNNDVEVTNLGINTKYSDFGTTELEDRIIFASSRGDGRKYKWNEQPFLDLYSASLNADGTYENVEPFSTAINTKYHESIATFTKNGNHVYFTRNNYLKTYSSKSYDGVNRLQMYRASKDDDGNWSDPVHVHFNDDDYSVAHPTVNKEGTRLYFASDMPGTIGQSDIYVVTINQDGSLGTPENLGVGINTEGQESFPFINTDGDLYYSSNGLPGLGGKDIFVVRGLDNQYANSSSRTYNVENVSRPYNSKADDFGYYENLVTKKGFFSSNRKGGKGDDDIYSFTIPECKQVLEGVILDKDSREAIADATVILFDGNGNEIDRQQVGADGKFNYELMCNTEYLVRAEKETYSSDEKRLTTPERKQELGIELLLEKDEQEISPCDDLAKVLDIPIIYFDFDKYYIRADAAIELQKVLAVLNKYPTMTIDIRSHTDSRGTFAYNETLSSNRAKSTRQYLIDEGIAEGRLTAKGYGEYQLVNECSDGVKCSEEKHQDNRRSEFIITSLRGETCIED